MGTSCSMVISFTPAVTYTHKKSSAFYRCDTIERIKCKNIVIAQNSTLQRVNMNTSLHYSGYSGYHPVVVLPEKYDVLDFTTGQTQKRTSRWSIGKYDEDRQLLYKQARFTTDSGSRRTVHLGIDIGAPVGTAVHAFHDGAIFHMGYNPDEGDYGHFIVTEHKLPNPIYALHGHLSNCSIHDKRVGDRFKRGDVIGWLGNENENGGWPPHVHFQISPDKPISHDMPGVCHVSERDIMLSRYPDPRIILGDIY